jgi:pimeloyl-ACP methyl ester carboxylesterase
VQKWLPKLPFTIAFLDIGLKRLETIGDIPCLLIWGDQDNVIPKKNSEDFKKALVKAKYEIVENVGHAPVCRRLL